MFSFVLSVSFVLRFSGFLFGFVFGVVVGRGFGYSCFLGLLRGLRRSY